MTYLSLHDAVVQLDNAAGSLVDISASVIDASLRDAANIGRHHTLASIQAKATEGGRTVTATIGVEVDTSTTSAHGLLRAWRTLGGRRTLVISRPDASTTGSVQYSGETLLGAIDPLDTITAGSPDVAKSTATLELDGDLSIAIVA